MYRPGLGSQPTGLRKARSWVCMPQRCRRLRLPSSGGRRRARLKRGCCSAARCNAGRSVQRESLPGATKWKRDEGPQTLYPVSWPNESEGALHLKMPIRRKQCSCCMNREPRTKATRRTYSCDLPTQRAASYPRGVSSWSVRPGVEIAPSSPGTAVLYKHGLVEECCPGLHNLINPAQQRAKGLYLFVQLRALICPTKQTLHEGQTMIVDMQVKVSFKYDER
ncbi:hypothetical protein EJ08DRAFT_447303 [Tothia fuscella]|uniref:Uncharacterized protein n=1 Tax=Tothia fuscella TaxID=1048955 RepID=A0A9P4TTV2_9PEZI|nr:hypothetical protein EJ08DRAFT_447303 [Tothia fuscella]